MSRSTWVDRGAPAAVILAAIIFGGVVALADLADEPLAPCTPTSTSVCTGPPADHSPNGEEYDSLPPCLTEDSDNCVWDASEQGNGQGSDVVNQP
ncbi:hypothetical protein PBI_HYPERION_102 [Microbacterium phage Hyperion]|uniref:Uncharacterized protein n=1 Tax=Microbacterium phage Hyperion TaxID=2182354 RepID=A0A2U8UIY8_9CAUD|nr:hypothetical protein HOT27_gp102 [Microbacterium phage Hyperion]AWN03617.1 hypothetical protein PBI_HYPERION_102 [Microbacterium phage Hyperion]